MRLLNVNKLFKQVESKFYCKINLHWRAKPVPSLHHRSVNPVIVRIANKTLTRQSLYNTILLKWQIFDKYSQIVQSSQTHHTLQSFQVPSLRSLIIVGTALYTHHIIIIIIIISFDLDLWVNNNRVSATLCCVCSQVSAYFTLCTITLDNNEQTIFSYKNNVTFAWGEEGPLHSFLSSFTRVPAFLHWFNLWKMRSRSLVNPPLTPTPKLFEIKRLVATLQLRLVLIISYTALTKHAKKKIMIFMTNTLWVFHKTN